MNIKELKRKRRLLGLTKPSQSSLTINMDCLLSLETKNRVEIKYKDSSPLLICTPDTPESAMKLELHTEQG